MAQRSDLVPVSPDEGAVRLTVGVQSAGGGAAASGETLQSGASSEDETWLMAAVETAGESVDARAIASDLRADLSLARLDDSGNALRQSFRNVNSSLYQQGMGANTASAVVLLARGKYATIASTGEGHVYLMRAGRLNQVTRGAATPQPLKSGKSKPPAAEVVAESVLLGSREKLDARQPAIFELTLLPEDRVVLCTGSIVDALDEKSLIAQLAVGDISSSLAVLDAGAGAAAVATVAAARERQPVVVANQPERSIAPVLAAVAVLLLIIAAVILYGYL